LSIYLQEIWQNWETGSTAYGYGARKGAENDFTASLLTSILYVTILENFGFFTIFLYSLVDSCCEILFCSSISPSPPEGLGCEVDG